MIRFVASSAIIGSLMVFAGCPPTPTPTPGAGDGGIMEASVADATIPSSPCPLMKCPPFPDAAPPVPSVKDAGPKLKDAAPPKPSPIDAGDLADRACTNMANFCSEGRAADCAVTLRKIVAGKLTKLDLTCIAGSTSAATVKTCGTIACTSK